jgi:hypothetical protein
VGVCRGREAPLHRSEDANLTGSESLIYGQQTYLGCRRQHPRGLNLAAVASVARRPKSWVISLSHASGSALRGRLAGAVCA